MVELNEKDVNTEFIFMSADFLRRKEIRNNNLKIIGFLIKTIKNKLLNYTIFTYILLSLLPPTCDECVGIVYCESAAYRLSVIFTYRVLLSM